MSSSSSDDAKKFHLNGDSGSLKSVLVSQSAEGLPDIGVMPEMPVVPKSFQVKALVRKNLKLQMRQKCTTCCQILVPFFLVLVLGVMQVMFNVLIKKQFGEDKLELPKAENLKHLQESDTEIYVATNGLAEKVGNLTVTGDKTGFLSGVRQSKSYYIDEQGKNVTGFFPYAQMFDTTDSMKSAVKKDKQKYQSLIQGGRVTKVIQYPTAAIEFELLNLNVTKPMNISFGIAVEEQGNYPKADNAQRWLMGTFIELSLAYAKIVDGTTTLDVNYQPLPYKRGSLSIDIGSFLSALFYPLVLTFILPVFVYNIVLEKQEKLREMQKMMGLKMRNYWAVMFFYNWALYLVILFIVVGLSLAFQFAIFTQASPLGNLVTFFLWGNYLIALSFFVSTFFSRTRTATILCYIVMILAVVVSFVINGLVWQFDEPQFWWSLIPPMPFYRIMYLQGVLCGGERCPKLSDYTSYNNKGGQIINMWIYMFVEMVVMFLLTNYLDNILPKEFGVSKKVWYPLKPIYKYLIKKPYRYLKNKSKDRTGKGERQGLLVSELNSMELSELTEPDDVARERTKVYNGELAPDTPVVIVDLHKKYGSRFTRKKKVAVKNLTFSIPKGECFGLLGPNGAGKTTTISILTGLFPPTKGYAKIGGFDIRTDINKVHRVMGVCPQFDTLWMDLTCKETLMFYARLKGIGSRFWGKKSEARHAMESLREVGLENFANRLVKKLSGGMRRRLSVAVSLIGNPKIVFLDEPTTGLDPESRRKLWDVLSKVKEARSIILTTHSMEEADVLCDRIGIMSLGTLRCVGPQQELKMRYGAGYTLKINYASENEDSAKSFISEILPTSILKESFAGQSTYQIPKKDMVISDLFEQMEDAHKAGITDWGINQTSLEDVFLSIVREEETDE